MKHWSSKVNESSNVKEDGGRRSERMYGRFSRVIPLPEGAKGDRRPGPVPGRCARSDDTVREARAAEKRRQIPIESGASANSAQQQGK